MYQLCECVSVCICEGNVTDLFHSKTLISMYVCWSTRIGISHFDLLAMALAQLALLPFLHNAWMRTLFLSHSLSLPLLHGERDSKCWWLVATFFDQLSHAIDDNTDEIGIRPNAHCECVSASECYVCVLRVWGTFPLEMTATALATECVCASVCINNNNKSFRNRFVSKSAKWYCASGPVSKSIFRWSSHATRTPSYRASSQPSPQSFNFIVLCCRLLSWCQQTIRCVCVCVCGILYTCTHSRLSQRSIAAHLNAGSVLVQYLCIEMLDSSFSQCEYVCVVDSMCVRIWTTAHCINRIRMARPLNCSISAERCPIRCADSVLACNMQHKQPIRYGIMSKQRHPCVHRSHEHNCRSCKLASATSFRRATSDCLCSAFIVFAALGEDILSARIRK